MPTQQTLPPKPGDMLRCRRCHRDHVVIPQPAAPSTAYAAAMLYVRCGKDLFYVGQQVSGDLVRESEWGLEMQLTQAPGAILILAIVLGLLAFSSKDFLGPR
jgi:hypothetical protein